MLSLKGRIMKLKGVVSQILVIFIILILLLITNQRTFYWDSEYYFQLGQNFSFATYNNSLRGYFLPFFIHCILKISSLINGSFFYFWWLVTSVLYGISFFTFIPNFFERIFNLKFNYMKRIIFAIIILFFWRGLIIYPLSDMPAICSLIFGILLLVTAEKDKYKNFSYLLSGVCIAMSCNLRPIYASSLILIVLFLIIRSYTQKIYFQFLCFMMGFFILSYPQILINKREFNTYSPLVISKYSGKENEQSLYLHQLFWGLKFSKYETNINQTRFPSVGVTFSDPTGEIILKSSIITGANFKSYFRAIFNYPVEMFSIYSKHIFSGLDHTFPEIYIEDIYRNRVLFSILNYTFWFLGTIGIFKIIKKLEFQNYIYLLIYITPVMLSIPTAIEPRFFMPMHLIIYFIAIYFINEFLQKNIEQKRNIFKKYFLNYAIFIAICFILSSYSFLSITDGYIIFNNVLK
jgi:hypothetical protein